MKIYPPQLLPHLQPEPQPHLPAQQDDDIVASKFESSRRFGYGMYQSKAVSVERVVWRLFDHCYLCATARGSSV